jgi:hypothetical protein
MPGFRAPCFVPGGLVWETFSTSVIVWVGPLKPHLGVSRFWHRLIVAGTPGDPKPFSGAEKPPIAFICELEKQVRRGLVLRSEGQSAISDRAGVAHGISNRSATERGFKYRKKIWFLAARLDAGRLWDA